MLKFEKGTFICTEKNIKENFEIRKPNAEMFIVVRLFLFYLVKHLDISLFPKAHRIKSRYLSSTGKAS